MRRTILGLVAVAALSFALFIQGCGDTKLMPAKGSGSSTGGDGGLAGSSDAPPWAAGIPDGGPYDRMMIVRPDAPPPIDAPPRDQIIDCPANPDGMRCDNNVAACRLPAQGAAQQLCLCNNGRYRCPAPPPMGRDAPGARDATPDVTRDVRAEAGRDVTGN